MTPPWVVAVTPCLHFLPRERAFQQATAGLARSLTVVRMYPFGAVCTRHAIIPCHPSRADGTRGRRIAMMARNPSPMIGLKSLKREKSNAMCKSITHRQAMKQMDQSPASVARWLSVLADSHDGMLLWVQLGDEYLICASSHSISKKLCGFIVIKS